MTETVKETKTEMTVKEDGTEEGTSTTTTTDAEGNMTVETTVTTETKTPDGSTGTTVKDGDGIVSVAEMPRVEIQVPYNIPSFIGMAFDLLTSRWLPIKECYEGSIIVPVTGSGEVAPYALDAMRWAVGTGLIDGMDGKLDPSGSATRAQVAAIMTRFVRNAK